MAYIKLVNNCPDHPKIAGLSDKAFRWWVRGLCYASAFLTDGKLPPAFLNPAPAKVKTELLDAGLWVITDGQTIIHDYLDHQTSKERVEVERERLRDFRNKNKPPEGSGRTPYARRTNEVQTPDERSTNEVQTPDVQRSYDVKKVEEERTSSKNDEVRESARPRGGSARRHDDPFGMKTDPNAVEMVVIDDGRWFPIPRVWWDKQCPAYKLTTADAGPFARWLGPRVRADGGVIRDNGKRLGWLDKELASWLKVRTNPTVVHTGPTYIEEIEAATAKLASEPPRPPFSTFLKKGTRHDN